MRKLSPYCRAIVAGIALPGVSGTALLNGDQASSVDIVSVQFAYRWE